MAEMIALPYPGKRKEKRDEQKIAAVKNKKQNKQKTYKENKNKTNKQKQKINRDRTIWIAFVNYGDYHRKLALKNNLL